MMSFEEVVKALEEGSVRVAEKTPEGWKVNSWVKEAILEGFRKGKLVDMSKEEYSFFDKDTLPLKKFSLEDRVRIVPGGSSVRCGAYLAPSVIMMPPSFSVVPFTSPCCFALSKVHYNIPGISCRLRRQHAVSGRSACACIINAIR